MDEARKLVVLLGFYARRSLVYKIDTLSDVLGSIVLVWLLVYFWSLAGDVDGLAADFNRLGYFMVAYSASRLSVGNHFHYVGELSKEIRAGTIGHVLLMPVNSFAHIAVKGVGRKFSQMVTSIILLIIGLFISQPPAEMLAWLPLLLGMSIAMGYYLSMLASVFSLTIVDAAGVRFALSFILRVVGGLFIPLSLMPGLLRAVLEYSPLSYPVYWFSAASSGVEFNVVLVAGIGLAWVALMAYAGRRVFSWGLVRAEVVGL